ncbi:MFS transporter [Acidipropionibacterium jensenii]|uniref:MFS transporter n=1 Tax=Acidipropionibacterium jensenii TaxID=1749 RepID=UPI00214AED0D|nr:MFS transporter [Acidipropionibacterium jensenii]
MAARAQEPEQTRGERLPSGFWWWAAATAVSGLGTGVGRLAISWSATGLGARTAGWVSSFTTLPTIVLVLLGGALGDRIGQRLVLTLTTSASILQYLTFLILLHLHVPLLPLLLINALVLGSIDGFATPSTAVYARLLVSAEDVPRAVSITNTRGLVVGILAPTIGGVIVSRWSLAGALWVDLVSFIGVLAVLILIRPARSSGATHGSGGHIGGDVLEGITHLAHEKCLVELLLSLILVSAGMLTVNSLALPLLVRSRHWRASSLGMLSTAWSAGSLIVSVLISARGPARRPVVLMVAGVVLSACSCFALMVTPTVWAGILVMACMGSGVVLFTGHLGPAFIFLTPGGEMSRFSSVLHLAQVLPVAVAAPVIGTIAQRFSVQEALLTMGLLVLGAGVLLCTRKAVRDIVLP